MNAPPVLRPLRAILQRRLQLAHSRPTRTPYYIRASQHRLLVQRRYNSSTPPDDAPDPENSAPEGSNEHPKQISTDATPSVHTVEDSQHVIPQTEPTDGEFSVRIPRSETNLPGHDAAPTPRLDSLFVKSAFQQLKTADGDIQAGIAEAVASQLEASEASTSTSFAAKREMTAAKLGGLLGASEELDAPDVAENVLRETVVRETITTTSESAQEVPQAGSDQAVTSESIQARESVQEAVADEPGTTILSKIEAMVGEVPLSQAESTPSVANEGPETAPTRTSGEETAAPKAAAPEPAVAPGNTPPAAPAIPGLEAFAQSSPEQIAALMAYLQQLQSGKIGGPSQATAPQAAAPKPLSEQAVASNSTTSESSAPDSPSAGAVASMTAPVEPSGQQAEAEVQQDPNSKSSSTAPSDSSSTASPDYDTMLDGLVAEPKPASTAPEPLRATPNLRDGQATLSEGKSSYEKMLEAATGYEAMLEAVTAEAKQASIEGRPDEAMSADEFAARRAVLEAELSDHDGSATEATSGDVRSEAPNDLESVIDAALADKVEAAVAAGHDAMPAAPVKKEIKVPQAKRLPRNVQAYYLQPLRREAQYGVPSCDLQLRSYNVRPLESFCDFALRAAYYLGLPAFGPTPMPKIIERWTVPRSVFIHKKSQENFERITRRRLIQIKDGHPETVQIWLAFLQKHQQAAVGMKANMWEFSSLDVAQEMDKAHEEARDVIEEKLRLLSQTKDFPTPEKADEFLQAERHRLTGGQYTGGM